MFRSHRLRSQAPVQRCWLGAVVHRGSEHNRTRAASAQRTERLHLSAPLVRQPRDLRNITTYMMRCDGCSAPPCISRTAEATARAGALAGAHLSVAQSHRLRFGGDDCGGRILLFGSTSRWGMSSSVGHRDAGASRHPCVGWVGCAAGSPVNIDLWCGSRTTPGTSARRLVPLVEQFEVKYSQARDFRADISKALRESRSSITAPTCRSPAGMLSP